jgi:hypothetical protein
MSSSEEGERTALCAASEEIKLLVLRATGDDPESEGGEGESATKADIEPASDDESYGEMDEDEYEDEFADDDDPESVTDEGKSATNAAVERATKASIVTAVDAAVERATNAADKPATNAAVKPATNAAVKPATNAAVDPADKDDMESEATVIATVALATASACDVLDNTTKNLITAMQSSFARDLAANTHLAGPERKNLALLAGPQGPGVLWLTLKKLADTGDGAIPQNQNANPYRQTALGCDKDVGKEFYVEERKQFTTDPVEHGGATCVPPI